MILTINLDPVEALPKLYDAVDGITRMIMDAKDNVDNPETKAARETIVANAMKLLGAEPAVYAVYTLNGGTKQESASVRVKAEITGLAELLEQSTGTTLEAARDVEPGSSAWLLAGISVGCTVGAAVVTVLALRVHARLKKRCKTAKRRNKA